MILSRSSSTSRPSLVVSRMSLSSAALRRREDWVIPSMLSAMEASSALEKDGGFLPASLPEVMSAMRRLRVMNGSTKRDSYVLNCRNPSSSVTRAVAVTVSAILRRIGACLPQGYFVFTSNVDGQFQKAGFVPARIGECHGSIHHLQCLSACCDSIWPADDFQPEVDEARCLLRSAFPRCPYCGNLVRPNVLMFGDWGWLDARSDQQQQNLQNWLHKVDRLLVIEIGAGSRIPTVRRLGESLPGQLIRINPTEPELGRGKGVSIACGGLEALRRIGAALNELAAEPGAA